MECMDQHCGQNPLKGVLDIVILTRSTVFVVLKKGSTPGFITFGRSYFLLFH